MPELVAVIVAILLTVLVAFRIKGNAGREIATVPGMELIPPELQILVRLIGVKLGKLLRGQEAQNVIVQLGIGGSGKTTLIRHLTLDPSANATIETEDFRVYKREFEVTRQHTDKPTEKQKTSIVIADYRGQHYGTLIKGILDHTVDRRSDLRNGNINTLLFVVDVFFPCTDRTNDLTPQPRPDRERLRKHVEYWNEARLEALFGILNRGSVRNVGIFVNKCDLLTTDEGREEARQAIEPIVRLIDRWTDNLGTEPFVLMGSFKSGTGVNVLIDRFIKSAVYTHS